MPEHAAPDTITITEHHFEDIRSTGADVSCSVSERSLGDRSSGRVAALRALLADRGFAERDVMLSGVDRTAWSWIAIALGIPVSVAILATTGPSAALAAIGVFVLSYLALAALRAGTVTANLQIHCADAERVSRLLDALMDFGADPGVIAWRYDIAPAERGAWVARAIERAEGRAERIAAALGVRVLGVHAFDEQHTQPQTAYTAPVVAPAKVEEKARLGRTSMSVAQSLGESPSRTERAGVTVTVRYRIGPLGAA